MEYAVEGSANARKYLNALMPSMIKQLGLENSSKAVLVKVSDECPGEGFTIDVEFADAYLVMIKPRRLSGCKVTVGHKELALTLAHELVHVKQMAKGQLKPVKNGHTWMGKRYSNKTAYLSLPWEVEAFSRQEIIMRRALED